MNATAKIIPLFDTAFRTTEQRKADEASQTAQKADRRTLASTVWREVRGSGLPRPLVHVLQALIKCGYDSPKVGPSPAYVAAWCRMPPKTAARYFRQVQGQTCQGLGIDPAKVRRLSGWLYDYLEHGKSMCRTVDRS